MPENFRPRAPKSEKGLEVVDRRSERRQLLNEAFQKGDSAFQHIDLLRGIEFPILVDFNGVLVDNQDVPALNPEAPEFLEHLKQLGDVVIVTVGQDWQGIYNRLQELGIGDDVILITKNNFYCNNDHLDILELDHDIDPSVFWNEFAESPALSSEERELITRYNGNPVSMADAASSKRVGVLFNKPYRIPIVDDSSRPGDCNPGIDLLRVQEYGHSHSGSAVTLSFGDVIAKITEMKQRINGRDI